MTVDKVSVAASFNNAAKGYLEHALLQRTVADRLLERLQLVNIKPKVIVDAGSGPGGAARQLAKAYKRALIIQLDLSLEMLRHSKSLGRRFFSKQRFVYGDVEKLPVRQNSTDLFFSSLMLQWCNDLDKTFAQIQGALKRQGLFLFATLGPDTLKELRYSWAEADENVHVNTFIDMHDVGDALVRAGFVEPVMDVENITMTYEDCFALMKDLKSLGANNANTERTRGLTGVKKFKNMVSTYEKFRIAGRLPASYEIVYGHAWKPLQGAASVSAVGGQGNEVFFPVSSIRARD